MVEVKKHIQEAPAEREAGMQVCVGAQGVGKTYLNMHIISEYIKDNLTTKVKGRKCLIFDTNGEYTEGQFSDNGIANMPIQRIAIKDIQAWSLTNNSECRRIDAKNLSIKEKKEAIQYIIKVFKNGMLVLDDINTYILSMTHMEEIVGGLVNLRHRAVDVLISYQRLRAVEPLILSNARWVRMHYQVDNIDDVKGKISETELFNISQVLVNNQYFGGNERFYVTIWTLKRKVEGEFSKRQFDDACRKYLNANKKEIKNYMALEKCGEEQAILGKIKQYRAQHYGN